MKITENTGIGNNDMSNPLATATTGQKTFMNTGLPLFSGFENKVALTFRKKRFVSVVRKSSSPSTKCPA